MKRRDFVVKGTSGALGAGLAGCSTFRSKKIVISEPEFGPIDLETKLPKPIGTMPKAEIGTTGITVSKFGFGSHLRRELVPLEKYDKVRERIIREAYDLGINFFDVYDVEMKMFQYEPMGRYLAPIINDVVISIRLLPYDGRSLEEEFERDLRMFRRDYIDMVRFNGNLDDWELLLKWKEQGKIRTVGVAIHDPKQLKETLVSLPIDYVILVFNFYHNWYREEPHNFRSLIEDLRERGIGVVTMKPMLGDRLATPFRRIAEQLDETGEVNFPQACLRYIINHDINFDSTLSGMFNPYHLYQNIATFFSPEMSDEERMLLSKVRNVARVNGVSKNLLPEHYRFLEKWVPDSWDDSDLFGSV